ncbi:MAG: S8 family serine peptidase [Acidobacteria bacterium]|nr:S8 family serine peptidase [Acidobacteriota bacterium]
MTRRILFTLLLMLGLTAYAEAQTPAQIPVIVGLSSGTINSVVGLLHGTVLDSIPGSNIYLLSLPVPAPSLLGSLLSPVTSLLSPVTSLLSQVTGLLGVQFAEVNTSGVTPPNVGQLSVLQPAGGDAPDWYKAQPAWQIMHAQDALAFSRGAGVIIADLNSSVDSTHPAIANHLTGGFDFVTGKPAGYAVDQHESSFTFMEPAPSPLDQLTMSLLGQSTSGLLNSVGLPIAALNPAYSHGTECAGVLAAIAPDSWIMPLRVFDDNGQSDLFTIAKAIRYAVDHNAQVINMSLGTTTNSSAIQNSVTYAQSMNVTLTASAGNSNTNIPQYPAAYSGVITTAATDISDKKASFSNYGSDVVMDAPGVNIILPYPGGLYSVVSGTSFSAPVLAGTAALVRVLQTTGTTAAITGAAVNINAQNPSFANQLGFGRIDVLQAVQPD